MLGHCPLLMSISKIVNVSTLIIVSGMYMCVYVPMSFCSFSSGRLISGVNAIMGPSGSGKTR